MILPSELSKNTPRDIDYSHALFSKNRKKVKSILIGSVFIIPLVILIFWWKFDDVFHGAIWGVCVASFFELFAMAIYVNTKKSVELFKNGTATIGVVESMDKPTDKQGNAYFIMKVSYADKQGMTYNGNVAMIGKATEADKNAGDQITILYFDDKPTHFAVYTEGMGITMSRSKPAM